jgi:hypothetical protein
MGVKTSRILWILCLVLIMVGVLSCGSFFQKHQDPFYNNVGTWDSLNLPLIPPYSLVYINKEYDWQMELKGNFSKELNNYFILSLQNVEKVAVEKGVIMVYTPHAPNVDESLGQKSLYWFVAIPHEGNSEIGFEDEVSFLDFIRTIGISSPRWVQPNVAYDEFFQTGCVYWIPDCK